ncbi:MAG TPA: hypothetical protein VFY29_14255 [Terriglobia bacterium]|nr:hypothetical protein [Terriglobia bacterium]
MRKKLYIVGIGLMFALASCGGGEEKKEETQPTKSEAPAATATLMGKISFEGAVPENPKIQMKADPKCPQDPNARAEEYVVTDGGLDNVIVYISSGIEGKKFPVPSSPVVIDQHGCHYVPHAFTVQTGQTIKITNSDDTAHNIHALADKNTPFNFAQPVKGAENEQKFDKPEMPLKVKCDVHPWMGAWIGVFDHPYHTVSAKGGQYEIKLPPGKYEVTAWHEKLGSQKQMVEVTDSGMVHADFTFKAEGK